jgi:hypothetical protein
VELLPAQKYEIVRDFWRAVSRVWEYAWAKPRTHLLTKGVGVTALSMLAADIITAALAKREKPDAKTFEEYLKPLADLDWSSDGVFKGFGGRHGAAEAHRLLVQRLFAPGLAVMRVA